MSQEKVQMFDKLRFKKEDNLLSIIAINEEKIMLDDGKVYTIEKGKYIKYSLDGIKKTPVYRRHSLPNYPAEYYIAYNLMFAKGATLTKAMVKELATKLNVSPGYVDFVISKLDKYFELQPTIKPKVSFNKINLDGLEPVFQQERDRRHIRFRHISNDVTPLNLVISE